MSFFIQGKPCLDVFFFTSFPHHRDRGQQNRHSLYIKVLEKYCGITVISGRYKKKTIYATCPNAQCRQGFSFPTHEEKETDVALGVQIISDLYTKNPDLIVIVSNDTDFKPAVKNVLHQSDKKILILHPLGVSKKKQFHYNDLEKAYPDRLTKKVIKEIQMKNSIMPNKITVDDIDYLNPYKSSP